MTDNPLERLHSERGPSAAHRWRPCPGSVVLCRGLPDDAGIEAALGTVFHEFAALTLEFDVNQHMMVGSLMEVEANGQPIVLEFDQEMATKMQPGIDWIRAYEGPGTLLLVEKRLDLQEWVGEGEFGTSDAGIIDIENCRIVVFDWKWGAGVPVAPYHNDQAMLYFLGFWSTYARDMFAEESFRQYQEAEGPRPAPHGAPETVEDWLDDNPDWADGIEVIINIEQPRAPGGGGVWKTTVGELLTEGRKIKADAEMTERDDAPLVPGEKQCRFCPASRHQVCPVERDFVLSGFDISVDDLDIAFLSGSDLDLRDRKALTPEQRSALVMATSQIKKYLDALHAEAFIDAENGVEVPGMFLAEGRRPGRKWKDIDKAGPIMEMRLKDDAWEKKWMTPTAVEELVGRSKYARLFEALVEQGEAKPQLVPSESGKTPVKSRREQLDDAFDEAAQETDTLI